MLLLCLTKFNQRFLPQLGVFAQKNSPTFNKPRLVLLQFGVTKPGWYGGKIPTKRERATCWVSHLSWRTMAHGFNGRCWKQCEKTRDLKEKTQRERINDRHDQTNTNILGVRKKFVPISASFKRTSTGVLCWDAFNSPANAGMNVNHCLLYDSTASLYAKQCRYIHIYIIYTYNEHVDIP